jgi:hypothetical protein
MADWRQVRTVDQLLAVGVQMRADDSQLGLAIGIQRAVSARFVHGYSRFTWRQNPYLAAADALFPDPDPIYSAPVRPADILAYPMAACSQQAIVMQAVLARAGIPFASVRWGGYGGGHFAVAARVDGAWRYFDPNMEPAGQGVRFQEMLDRPDTIRAMYFRSLKPGFAVVLADYAEGRGAGTVRLDSVNENPAPRGAALQTVTFALTFRKGL